MRDMASTDDCLNLRSGKRVGDLGDHRSKHRGAQVSGCEERRFRKRDDALKIEGKLLRIIHLVEKSWSVFREDLSGLGWELGPGARSESHGFDKFFGGPGMISRRNAINHSAKPFADFLKHGRAGGIVRKKREQRWFMRNDSSQQVRALARQAECNRCAKRIAGNPSWCQIEMLNQRSKVGDILVDAALPWRTMCFDCARDGRK